MLALPTANTPGDRVVLSKALVKDKKTLLFFHAPWSKTSGRYLVELEAWAKSHKDMEIVQVDVKTLKSPVAKQFKLDEVPAFKIYNERGELDKEGQEAHNEVTKLLQAP